MPGGATNAALSKKQIRRVVIRGIENENPSKVATSHI
jgi:hypothetical protein